MCTRAPSASRPQQGRRAPARAGGRRRPGRAMPARTGRRGLLPGPHQRTRRADAVDCARAWEGALRLKLFPWLLSVLTRSDTHRGHLPFAQLGLSNYRETLV